jgi:hypothetical protein
MHSLHWWVVGLLSQIMSLKPWLAILAFFVVEVISSIQVATLLTWLIELCGFVLSLIICSVSATNNITLSNM